jgi:hypothetical protein
MPNTYHCPRCSGLLNPGTKVIFVLEQGPNRGLLLLSPELGDYAVVLAESFPIESGEVCSFRCPICHGDLTSDANDKLVEILCRKPDQSEVRVAFSRVAGEHATFVCGPRGVSSYGEHAERYEGMNFFGAGDDESLHRG